MELPFTILQIASLCAARSVVLWQRLRESIRLHKCIRGQLDSAVARAVQRKTGRLVNGRIKIQWTGCSVTSSGCRRHVVAKRFGRTTCLT